MADKQYRLIMELDNGERIEAGEFVVPEGDQGPKGEQGEPGTSINITEKVDSAEELPEASEEHLGECCAVGDDNEIYVCVELEDGTITWVNFGSISGIEGPTGPTGPKGDTGDTGNPGTSATITVTATDTLDYGEDATVTNEGTSTSVRLHFGIPQGKPGDKGERGDTGEDGFSPYIEDEELTEDPGGRRVHIFDREGDHPFDIWNGKKGEQGDPGPKGDTGPIGPPPTLRQGRAEKVDYGVDPWFSVTYIEDGVYDMDMGIPQGPPGEARAPSFRTERFKPEGLPPYTRIYVDVEDDEGGVTTYPFDIYDGDTGDTGDTGPQGPQGSCGARGPQGYCGLRGYCGPRGVCGSRGVQGYCGLQGPQGYCGLQGPQGYCGLQGPQGDTGLEGPRGATGPQGYCGPQGPQGATGSQGPTGYCGPQGYCGLQGPQGATGPQGPQGIAGASVISISIS